MSDNQSGQNDSNLNKMVVFEIFPDIKEDDFDLLIMFLENRKQSGGGDIIDMESLSFDTLESKNKLKIAYDDIDAKNRVLNKKFLKFKNYQIKASDSNINSSITNVYEINNSKIIIKDILIQDDSSDDDSIVRMYAEHLAPDNDIVQIQRSNLYGNTFYIEYQNNIDRDLLKSRYNKKPKLRNKQINILDSFQTKSFIISSIAKMTQKADFDQIKNKIIEEIEKRDLNSSYFINLDDKYLLFEFSNDSFLKDLTDSIKIYLHANNCDFVLEEVFNFDLLNNIHQINKTTLKVENKEIQINQQEVKKYVDVGVQTDLQTPSLASNLPIDNQIITNGRKENKINMAKNSQPSSLRSSFSEADSEKIKSMSSKSSLSSSSGLSSNKSNNKENQDSIKNRNMSFSDLNEGSENSYICLDPNEFYTIALLNTKQLFINFQSDLKRINKNLELRMDRNQIIISNLSKQTSNNDWKLQVMLEINEFFSHRALYKVTKIPNDILNNEKKMKTLAESVVDLNKQSSAYYFRIMNQDVHGYGCKKALNQKIQTLNDLFKSISSGMPSTLPESKQIIQNFASNKSVASSSSTVDTNSVLKDFSMKTNQNILNSNFMNYKLVHEIESTSLTWFVLSNLKQIMHDFKNSIKNFNAEVAIQNDGKRIILNCTSNALQPIDWTNRIKAYLGEFEKNQISRRKIDIPVSIRGQKELDDLKTHLKRFFSNINTLNYEIVNSSISYYGYTKVAENFEANVYAKFKNLENNIKDRIKTKLDIRINYNKRPLDYTVLNRFNGIYFKEFTDGLAKLNASIENYSNNKKDSGYKINCNLDKKNEQVVESWRSKINSYMTDFFSRFSIQKLNVNYQNFEKLKFDDALINFAWLNTNEAEIVGVKAEVNKVINLLNGKTLPVTKVPASSEPKSSTVSNATAAKADLAASNSNKKEETFLINDLKWFQTRILFEKKYFQYVTETFKDLKVLLDTQLTRIFFTGGKIDIEKAKCLAFEILKQILGAEVECDPITLKKMSSNENQYINLFKQNNLCCVIDTKSHNDRFTIYATNYEDIEKCKTIIGQIKI